MTKPESITLSGFVYREKLLQDELKSNYSSSMKG